MIISDALSILGLSSGASQDEIKAAYKAAAKKYHPDLNPDASAAGDEMMKLVNAAYDALKNATSTETEEATNSNYGEELNAALNAIINLDGLEIEICGSWIWVSGDTYPHRVALDQANFKYARKKKKWNFRPAGWKSRSRGQYSMDQIRERHGSVRPSKTHFGHASLEAAA
ncbi:MULTISPECIES: J domain-containing protein [unclassified Pseudovibrio]|uniref:J domain-containing protein n=1 Tax=unclassified Pseudovibrio TaxID=2627060 RepID=UPI0007AE653B|nr:MULTISPECIES: J domain-containing protein [unclassified Pseudovibrio]KZK92535.1 Chaperone protein DnaJ [Pseudovibrio sp. W74]KZL03192.1 Chaperone protein DnaJ [Pseudovibrio sp. Ad14]